MLVVPAGVKLALDGTKLTENRDKGEVVTEGEATCDCPTTSCFGRMGRASRSPGPIVAEAAGW
jgi:hypothetical protein